MADPGRADQGESRDHWVSTTQHAPASSPPPPHPPREDCCCCCCFLGCLGAEYVREEAPPLPLGLSEGSEPKTEAKFLLHEMNKMEEHMKVAKSTTVILCVCCK